MTPAPVKRTLTILSLICVALVVARFQVFRLQESEVPQGYYDWPVLPEDFLLPGEELPGGLTLLPSGPAGEENPRTTTLQMIRTLHPDLHFSDPEHVEAVHVAHYRSVAGQPLSLLVAEFPPAHPLAAARARRRLERQFSRSLDQPPPGSGDEIESNPESGPEREDMAFAPGAYPRSGAAVSGDTDLRVSSQLEQDHFRAVVVAPPDLGRLYVDALKAHLAKAKKKRTSLAKLSTIGNVTLKFLMDLLVGSFFFVLALFLVKYFFIMKNLEE